MVLHSLTLALATKGVGPERPDPPFVTVTAAQFMYISRLPAEHRIVRRVHQPRTNRLTSVIEPCPCEKRFTRRRLGGKIDIDSRRVGQTASDVGFDDVPRCTLVVTHGELTTASLVSGGTSQGYIDGLASFPGDHRVHVRGSGGTVNEALARIDAVRDQWRSHRVVLGVFRSLGVEGGMQGIRP